MILNYLSQINIMVIKAISMALRTNQPQEIQDFHFIYRTHSRPAQESSGILVQPINKI